MFRIKWVRDGNVLVGWIVLVVGIETCYGQIFCWVRKTWVLMLCEFGCCFGFSCPYFLGVTKPTPFSTGSRGRYSASYYLIRLGQ